MKYQILVKYMSFDTIPSEILLHIHTFLTFKECILSRLICTSCNIIDNAILKMKFRKYNERKYKRNRLANITYYMASFDAYYCTKCSNIIPNRFKLMHNTNSNNLEIGCKKNNELFVCCYGKPHVDKICDCPLSIIKCGKCNEDVYKFQYDYHINHCQINLF
jgi:hypothetical protein